MTHPDEHINKAQQDFLASCEPDDRQMHELLFKVGNATYRYYMEAKSSSPSEAIWLEWLEGLREPVKATMKKIGFQGCKSVLPFLRYVNERNDLGLEAYIEANLSKSDYSKYHEMFS